MRAGLPILAFADARAFDGWLESQGAIGAWALAKAGEEGRAEADAHQVGGDRRRACHG